MLIKKSISKILSDNRFTIYNSMSSSEIFKINCINQGRIYYTKNIHSKYVPVLIYRIDLSFYNIPRYIFN